MVRSAFNVLEWNWSPMRGAFVVCLIFFIVFQAYLINTPGKHFGRLFKKQESAQQTKKVLTLNGDLFGILHSESAQIVTKELILNENLFGPLQNDSVVIIVQVHNRLIYLNHLIKSLAQAKNISQTLLIFSHDYYDEDINRLIQKIKFCKILQIFFPYSVQKHEHEFPGLDPNDCPPDIPREIAIARNCINALHPDHYGHYRNAKTTQSKHHWWWKANRVFDQLDVTRYHTGPVIFLEEDHYVAEDFLYLLDLMLRRAPAICPKCKAFALGIHRELNVYQHLKSDQVDVSPWEHNMGFAFNRTTWREIVKCANQFCTYDDYNWDWTLRYVSQECLPSVLLTMAVKRPRVFHIGECGMHIKKGNCDPGPVISKIQQLQQIARDSNQTYPKILTLTSMRSQSVAFRPNGNWADVRDHKLCLSFTRNEQLTTDDKNEILT